MYLVKYVCSCTDIMPASKNARPKSAQASKRLHCSISIVSLEAYQEVRRGHDASLIKAVSNLYTLGAF